MPNDATELAASRTATSAPLRLYQVLVLVLLWQSGYKGARVVTTLYALELGASPFATGLLLSTYGLFPLVLAVPVGRIIDRYGMRLPIGFGMVVSALGVGLPFFWPTLTGLYAGAALSSVGFIFVQVGMQTLSGALGSGRERTANLNSYTLVVSSADLLGPVMSGFLIDHAGHVHTYLLLALFNVAAVAGLIMLARRFPGAAKGAGAVRRRMMDLLQGDEVRRVMLGSIVVMVGVNLFQLYMPLYGHAVGLSASAIGLAMGAYASAAFVTRALIPVLVRRTTEQVLLMYAMFLACAAFAAIPLFTHGFVLAMVCFVLGLGMGLGQPLAVILTYNYSPPGRAGEALGLRIAINNSVQVIAPSAFGALGWAFGLGPVFWVTAAVLALGAHYSTPRAHART